MTREEIYDAQISPLMTQIIALCKEHDVPCVAVFQINDDLDAALEGEEEFFNCFTAILPKNANPKMHQMRQVFRPVMSMFSITTVAGDGTMTREIIVTDE